MKKVLTFPLIIIMMIISSFSEIIYAENGNNVKTLALRQFPKGDRKTNTHNKEGHRMPSRPIICYIDATTGIDIETIDSDEIYLFEAYIDDICIASFSEEMEFVAFLFSYSNEVEIYIYTDDYVYIGFLSN